MQARRDALDKIARIFGNVTEDRLIESAKSQDSPFHHEFEWDDSKAAQEARRSTARRLIYQIKYQSNVVGKINAYNPPAYVRDPSSTASPKPFIPITSIEKRSEDARRVMRNELSLCMSAITRAKNIAHVLDVESELNEALRIVADVRQRAK